MLCLLQKHDNNNRQHTQKRVFVYLRFVLLFNDFNFSKIKATNLKNKDEKVKQYVITKMTRLKIYCFNS